MLNENVVQTFLKFSRLKYFSAVIVGLGIYFPYKYTKKKTPVSVVFTQLEWTSFQSEYLEFLCFCDLFLDQIIALVCSGSSSWELSIYCPRTIYLTSQWSGY